MTSPTPAGPRLASLLLSLLLAVAIGAPAAPAHAQSRTAASGWEVELDARYSGVTGSQYPREEEGPGAYGVFRHAWSSGLSLGLGGGFTSYDVAGADPSLDVLDVFAEGRWRLAGGGAFNPFLGARGGYTRFEQGAADDEGVKASMLGGFEVWVSDHVALHAAAVASSFHLFDQVDFDDGAEVGVQTGLVISFGGRGEPAPERPADADGDGVPDGRDACPGTPRGVAADADGCAADRDGDAVPDHEDDCPGTAAGARVDRQGCAIDGDGDGVADGLDRCPDTPRGAGVDDDGCATDGDGDGVPDGLDACPDTPEGEAVDAEGCTEIEAGIQRGRLALGNVHFAFGSAELRPESREVLDRVGRALLDRSDVTVQVQGHTDSIGSERVNRELSWARARSVRSYLLEQFPELDPERLVAVGMGETRPVADNGTEEGRAENRRVEFVVVEGTSPE